MSQARIALWIVTLAALAVCVRAIFIDVVPGVFAGSVLSALAVTYALGVFNPRWEMFGDVLDITGAESTSTEPQAYAVCLHAMPAAPSAQAQLLALAAQHDVHLLALIDAATLNKQSPEPEASSNPPLETTLDPNSTDPTSADARVHQPPDSRRSFALELPLPLVALCLVLTGPAKRWLTRGNAYAKLQGADVSCVLLPQHFAPSGCFIAAKQSGLGVALASRRRWALDTNQARGLRVLDLSEFPASPSSEQTDAWLTRLAQTRLA